MPGQTWCVWQPRVWHGSSGVCCTGDRDGRTQSHRFGGVLMIDVAIVGASGYAARELFRILLHHPGARITMATSRQDEGTRVDALHPSLAGRIDLRCEPFDPDRLAGTAQVAFLGLP